jgi:hypothetical protein
VAEGRQVTSLRRRLTEIERRDKAARAAIERVLAEMPDVALKALRRILSQK